MNQYFQHLPAFHGIFWKYILDFLYDAEMIKAVLTGKRLNLFKYIRLLGADSMNKKNKQ